MRALVDADRIRTLVAELGRAARRPARVLAGGATAVLLGWRASTIDVDLKLVPGVERGFVTATQVRETFSAIESRLYRYPAVDPAAFRRALEAAVGDRR